MSALRRVRRPGGSRTGGRPASATRRGGLASATPPAGLGRLRVGRPRRPRLRTVILLVALLVALGGGYLWLRDSSLVAVHKVTVTGLTGPDAHQIEQALVAAAHGMTTLDVQKRKLKLAVEPYPRVKDLRVSTQFPHGMKIAVVEETPVAAVAVGRRAVAVAQDGALLPDVSGSGLALISTAEPPSGARLTGAPALGALAILNAAPAPLRAHVSQVTSVAAHGLVAQLRDGPAIYFGDADSLGQKWASAAAVLADRGSVATTYIDVTYPQRPAAGDGTSSASGAGSAGAGGTSGAGGAGGAAGNSGNSGSSGSGNSGTSANSGDSGSSGSGSSGRGGSSASGNAGSSSGSSGNPGSGNAGSSSGSSGNPGSGNAGASGDPGAGGSSGSGNSGTSGASGSSGNGGNSG